MLNLRPSARREVHSHHVEARWSALSPRLAEKVLCGSDNSSALDGANHLFGVFSLLVGASLDLNENDRFALSGDEVDFPRETMVVAGDDAMFPASKIACLASPSNNRSSQFGLRSFLNHNA